MRKKKKGKGGIAKKVRETERERERSGRVWMKGTLARLTRKECGPRVCEFRNVANREGQSSWCLVLWPCHIGRAVSGDR